MTDHRSAGPRRLRDPDRHRGGGPAALGAALRPSV